MFFITIPLFSALPRAQMQHLIFDTAVMRVSRWPVALELLRRSRGAVAWRGDGIHVQLYIYVLFNVYIHMYFDMI